MFKIYNVITFIGSYKVIAFNKFFAKRKAYKIYKKSRNTNWSKFEDKIIRVRREV